MTRKRQVGQGIGDRFQYQRSTKSQQCPACFETVHRTSETGENGSIQRILAVEWILLFFKWEKTGPGLHPPFGTGSPD